MYPFSNNASAAYRRVDLDARIEASGGEELTRICLEEAVSALRRAERIADLGGAREPLSRAHAIALWLCRGVEEKNPLRDALIKFYGGLAAIIRRNMAQPNIPEIAQVRADFDDLLQAVRG